MNASRRLPSLATAIACAVLAIPAAAQERMPQSPRPAAPAAAAQQRAASADEAFARKAAAGGKAEVELAGLAQQRSTNPAVKELAAKIEKDHTHANSELMSIAGAKNWSLDTAPDAKQAALKNRLEKLDGQAFDRAYLDAMKKDHEKDIKAFQKQAEDGTDAELKAFAGKTLPHLQDHLRMTDEARRALTMTMQQQP